jgi:uncharacterized protein (DUF1501 family)
MKPPFDVSPDNASRRAFLKRASAVSIAAGAAPWALTLAGMGEAAAQTVSDYKALVCVFLYGGCDYANTLVPYDTAGHANYQGLRSNIALSRDALAATALTPATPLSGGGQYALHPNLAPLLPVFTGGKLAPILNIGTLVRPTTKTQYTNKNVALPPKLFSHNDQQSFWQASSPEGASSGWGGRLGDLFAAGNGTSTFTCINVSSNAVFLSGKSAVQYQITSTGSIPVNGLKVSTAFPAACTTALRGLLTNARTHLFENEYATLTNRSLSANDQLSTALAGTQLATSFPATNLGGQLAMVARIIASQQALGARRQVFFVSLGGFDTHDNLLDSHGNLMTQVGDALAAFYQSTQEIGLARNVTTFTATDFGRTLLSNNSGTDHGWGGVSFVMGDAVRGGNFYGTSPVFANNGPDDVGQGRLLPSTSVDQFAATLADWFGVSASDQKLILPNLGNFSVQNLGFMTGA